LHLLHFQAERVRQVLLGPTGSDSCSHQGRWQLEDLFEIEGDLTTGPQRFVFGQVGPQNLEFALNRVALRSQLNRVQFRQVFVVDALERTGEILGGFADFVLQFVLNHDVPIVVLWQRCSRIPFHSSLLASRNFVITPTSSSYAASPVANSVNLRLYGA
jgi:hypothetical protein